ncbi:MAG: cytochrome c peroxidase [Isosphaeraceae bacterium]
MPGSFSRFVPIACALPVFLFGCGQTGPNEVASSSTTTPATSAAADGSAVEADQAAAVGAETQVQKRTPNAGINPKNQVDIVREEIKGGEFQEGPTPFEYLWQPEKQNPEPDEPLNVEVPLGLPELVAYVPKANPLTTAKAALGKQLYFDARISKDGTVSCATCHNPEHGWTDQMPTSTGIKGQIGSRSAPTVLNTVYGRSMFWDGRAPSLEGQSQGPPQNPIEMGEQSYKEIIERLRTIPGYKEQFLKVFGTDVTLDGVSKAIATFERTALSGNSAYDKYTRRDMSALSETQKRGMILFGLRPNSDDPFKTDVKLKKAECTSCHIGFNFTDDQFHNLGVGWNEADKTFADLGRWAITPIGAKYDKELGAFKTPTLRDLSHTAPYMHDGSEQTLEEVVEFYDKGGNPNPQLDKDMKKLNLTKQEKADVVAFMKALDGETRKVELPTLPDGPDGTAPDPKKALTPPSAKAALGNVHGLVR